MPRKKDEPKGLVGIEPTALSLPAMDRVSVAFALTLDHMIVEWPEFGHPTLTCSLCSEQVCAVEDGDTLRVLLNTALAHTC